MTSTPAVQLKPYNLRFVGHGLVRPECVVWGSDQALHCPDWRGGLSRTTLDGHVVLTRFQGEGTHIRANGLQRCADGSFLVTHLGDAEGGVWHVTPQGQTRPLLLEFEGAPLPPTNFVNKDAAGRVWISVSTRRQPRHSAWRRGVADGFIICMTPSSTFLFADGLGYANEVKVHPSGEWLYVNETIAGRLSRYSLKRPPAKRETVCEFDTGTFPDGLCFDSDGGVWVVSVVSNRIYRIDAAGRCELMFEDCDPGEAASAHEKLLAGTLQPDDLSRARGRHLASTSSICFGGLVNQTLFIGSLSADRIASFETPFTGCLSNEPPPPMSFHLGS